jgi:hypothetical protein
MAKRLTPPTDADRQLAAAWQRKNNAGQKASKEEERAYRRVIAFNEEQARWKFYRAVPKGHYCALASRQQKIIDEQGARYGLPVLGPVVNLEELITAVHDLLAAQGSKLLAEDDEAMQGEVTPALEKWREEKWRLARLDRQEREGLLLPRDVVHSYLQKFASQLREQGEFLQREYGPDALEAWNERLDTIERSAAELLDGMEPAEEDGDQGSEVGDQ